MRFANKTVVITGAASGIGEATARLFAREGAKVVAADIDTEGGQRLASDSDGAITFHRCDVLDTGSIGELMDHAARRSGGIDIVVNNAGSGGSLAPIFEIEPEDWDRTMNLLLRSVAFGIRYSLPHMKGRPNASIVNTSSVAALSAGYSPIAYSVAKAGVLHLTKLAAAELARFDVRVNAVLPGIIGTNIFAASFNIPKANKEMVDKLVEELSSQAQPVKRGGLPNDIAEACAYLAGASGEFVTGTALQVDGGLSVGPRHSWDPSEPGLHDVFADLSA